MKKTFNLIGLCIMAIAWGVNVVACNCRNNDDTVPTGKRLKQISIPYGKLLHTGHFYYNDEGRIEKTVHIDPTDSDTLTCLYRYSEARIIVSHFRKDTAYGEEEYTLANGLITYGIIGLGKAGDEGGFVDYHFEYDDRMLVRCILNDIDSLNFTWKEGNIACYADEEPKYFSDDIAYSAERTPCRWDFWASCFDQNWEFEQNLALIMQGYFGESTKNRMKTQNKVSYDEDASSIAYTYEVDSDNYPTTITITSDGNSETINIVWE